MLPLHAARSGPPVDLDDIVATGVGVHSATVAGDAEHRSVEEALFGFEACGRAGLVGGLAAVGMHQVCAAKEDERPDPSPRYLWCPLAGRAATVATAVYRDGGAAPARGPRRGRRNDLRRYRHHEVSLPVPARPPCRCPRQSPAHRRPPETVVVVVPVQDDPDADAPDLVRYWLFDSHPRQLPAFTTPVSRTRPPLGWVGLTPPVM